ncbi:Uncharacterized protein dnl_29570 [Desulfonema limicola]|uniref:Uncharacterized protein n=1 Tax=Desulfonema limicola TaxID=45656 RepID=A0A975B8I5_9BACT|nr:hypothetical protein [Desulfonema limicola]QTA80646.1 Uncharacterized protein dnl_29570 [Desulfonema limicola]
MSKAKELIELLEQFDIKGDKNIKSIIANQLKEKADKNYDEEDINLLIDLYNELKITNEFKEGQVVKWKKGLKNKRLPNEEQPAIVVEILKEPIYSEFNSGTPYFREPLDLALGFIGGHNDFIIFHYDKRRFEPLKKE